MNDNWDLLFTIIYRINRVNKVIIVNGHKILMLSERKKYNYMVGSSMMSTRARTNTKMTPYD